MKNIRRQKRVAEIIHFELKQAFSRYIEDPNLKGLHLVSVRMSSDLKLATVIYEKGFFFKDKKIKTPSLLISLDHVKPFLKRILKEKLELRYIPELRFIEKKDEDAVFDLLSQLEYERTHKHPL